MDGGHFQGLEGDSLTGVTRSLETGSVNSVNGINATNWTLERALSSKLSATCTNFATMKV